MPNRKLVLRPGVNTQLTETANSAGFSESNLIRWRMGLLERMAGWRRLFEQTCANFVRAMHAYQDLDLNNNLLLGTDSGPQLYVVPSADAASSGELYDVSLTRAQASLAPPWYSFTNASPIVTVTDVAHGALAGDTVKVAQDVGGNQANTLWASAYTNSAVSNYFGVAWSGALFCAVGVSTGVSFSGGVATSTDGLTWTPRTLGAAATLYAVAFGNSVFVAVGAGGAVYTSPDAVTWTARTSGTGNDLNGVVWNGSVFVAVGSAGTIRTSTNGVAWAAQTSLTTANLNGVAWSGSLLCAVGSAGTIRTSPDAVTWTARTSGVTDTLAAVAFGGAQFVAVGVDGSLSGQGLVLTSPTGTTWTRRNLGSVIALNGIAYSSTQFLALGGGGRAFSSTDAITWFPQLTPVSGALAAVAASSSISVAVGGSTSFILNLPVVASYAAPKIPNGFYEVQTVPTDDTYTLMLPAAATVTGSTGGYPVIYALNQIGVANPQTVRAYLLNHGYTVGSTHTVAVTTYFANNIVWLEGSFTVTAVPNSYTFEFVSTQSPLTANLEYAYEGNSSSATIQYFRDAPTVPQNWFLDNLGNNGLYCPTNGPIYVYTPPVPGSGLVVGESINTGPLINAGMFVAMPQAQIFAFGSEAVIGGGVQDPLLVRYSDAGSFSDWVATSTNQAGSYRLSRGSRIVGGIQAPQTTLLWTDIDLWSAQYIGGSLVYSFNVIGSGCGLMSPKARAVQGRKTYWMTRLGFYEYGDGGVQPIDCPVWDQVFGNLDDSPAALNKIHAGANSSNFEVMWFYCSAGGSGEIDSYVKLNTQSSLWDYGSLCRTSWTDESVFGTALGADENFRIQQHEIGYNADGEAMPGAFALTGYADLEDGTYQSFLDEMQPDFKFLGDGGSVTITLFATETPGGPVSVNGPFPVTAITPRFAPRLRARQIAMRIDWATDTDFNARLGTPRIRIAPSGR